VYFSPFGSPNSTTFGEVFTVQTPDNILTGFSMFLTNLSGSRGGSTGPLNLQGFVAAWNGSRATALLFSATPLFSGEVQTMDAAVGDTQAFTYSTGNLQLQTGEQYVAFLSIADLPAQPDNTYVMPRTDDKSADGEFVSSNVGLNFGSLFDQDWSVEAGTDAELVANFASDPNVPEPATIALFGVGLVTVGFLRRSQRAL
jgi:hypothetical protein